MNSNIDANRVALADTLDALDDAWTAFLRTPLPKLTRSEQLEVIDRLEALDRKLNALQQRLIGRMVAESPYRTTSPADQLSKALRISPAEAQRRISAALRDAS